MNDLLSKFEDIEIANTNIIGQEDQKFCDIQFAFYSKVYRAYEAHLNVMIVLEKEQEKMKNEIKEQVPYSPTFIEKAIQEIKDKARTERNYEKWQKEWNYDVKGKIIKFRFNINNIQPALYLYDNGEQDIINCYTHNKIEDYRSYENGNTDIKFYKSEYAMEFTKNI